MGSMGEETVTTLLPSFNTTTIDPSGGSATSLNYHNVASLSFIPAIASADILLGRFAQLIHSITAADEVAFVADSASQRSIVYARPSHVQPKNASDLHQQPVDDARLDVGASDFGLHYEIVANRNDATTTTILTSKLHQPLVLSVSLVPEEALAHITLSLRQDYGPSAAARHLLDLAIAYLSPEINLVNTQKSQLTTAFPTSQQTSDTEFPRFLHSILEESARLYPHNIAIDEVTGKSASSPSSYERRALTYAELNEKVVLFAEQLEQVLHKLEWPDFQNGQKMVPIFLPNSTELNICMNAISKIGHSFCVFQTDAPEDRLRTLLTDLNCNGILGIGKNPWAGTAFGQSITWIDFSNPLASVEPHPVLPSSQTASLTRRQISQDDLAYIIYTSGSTGTPKGVIMHHRNAMAYLRAFDAGPGSLPIGPRLRWMIMSAPTFDIMLMDNFMALLKGGTVCMAARQLLLSNPESVLHELQATATFTVSSLAMLLRPERLPTLTTILVGGELIGQRIVDNFAQNPAETNPRRRLIGGYGPTEATVFVTNHVCHTDSRPSVLGAPFPGTRLIVLDETQSTEKGHLALAPLGVAGELAISTPQLSPGYLNKPDETARAFIHHSEFGRLYRTGDRVRIVWTADGEPKIDYLGRITTDQVKLNGRRVELPEIENVLSRTETAAQVAVLVFKSKLVAFVMPWVGNVNPDDATIEAHCRANAERFLPAWMQPKQYLVMNKLPYSVNGKVDRRALAAILARNEELTATNGTFTPPNPVTVDSKLPNGNTSHEATNGQQQTPSSNDIASAVYEAFADALGDVDIQGSTVLADTGFDSLRALVFLQCLEEHDITELDIHDILTAITVDDVVDMVKERRGDTPIKSANQSPPPALALAPEPINGHAEPTATDAASLVYEALDDALGCEVQGATSLADLGVDSLRALVLLQCLEERGITQVDIQDVLSAMTVDNLVDTIESRRSGGKEEHCLTNGAGTHDHVNNKEAHPVVTTATTDPTTTSTNTTIDGLSPFIDGIDVSKIKPDDDDEIFELSVAAKLRHFDYHCRAPALAALGLKSSQVEQVLPMTNVQTRFVALAVDPEYYDKTRLIGRPYVTHFPYALPSDMDPARFQRAVDAVLPRYDCFRAVFTPAEHSLAPFAQVILTPSAAKIPKVEVICDDSDADAPDSLWRETINGVQMAAEAAMSVTRPGITVSWVWSPNRARCVFVMTLFHAAYDGTQLGYLFDAVLAEYAHPGCTPPVDLLPMRRAVELNLSYDWVSTVVFWAGRLAGVPGSRLGTHRPTPKALLPASRPGCEMTHMRSLSVKASMTMRQLSKAAVAMSNSMLTVVEAAWASVLAQTFDDQQRAQPLDVQFGTVMNGRRHQDALRCMAPLVAALPMRLVVEHDVSQRRITNREVCALLSSQRSEATPYLQMPCPTLAHARMGTDRFDTLMLVQALQPESSKQTLRPLPGFNFDENLMAPYKEIDIGFPMATELWPGSLRWDEKMLIRSAYSTSRHPFLNTDFVLAMLSALDEAMVRITSEPDAVFYTG